MRFLERVLPGRHRAADPPFAQPRSSAAERQDPVETSTPAIQPPPAPPAARTDLTLLLGRNIVEQFTQDVCREYALLPASACSFQSPELGVSLTADDSGTVAMIFLHFHGDAGLRPYAGAIPGRGGTIPKRSSLWAALGRPDQSTDPRRDRGLDQYGASDQWRFPTFTMHARYAVDNENLLRLTLRH